MTTAIPRVLDLEKLVLKSGSHHPDSQFCVMEAVAYVAGEPWSDSPKCACPVLSAFLRRWNDDLDDAGRQILKPYIPKLVGSKVNKEVETVRGWMLTDWMIRVYTPAWLRLAKLDEQALALEGFPEITNVASLAAARPGVDEAGKKAAAARDAARDAAWDAAWDAARAAARDAARDAAWTAAWAAWAAARDAARDAAWAAARDAAWAAAWDAAWTAARAAAGDAAWDAAWAAAAKVLEPTKVSLQQSALVLLDRMLEVR